MNTTPEDTVYSRFFEPAKNALQAANRKRHCTEYTDESYIIAGIGRVIASVRSGRDWVQRLQAHKGFGVTVAVFFQALRSKRRQALTDEVAALIRDQVDDECSASYDPLAKHVELHGYAVFASDGHYESAATHTRPVEGQLQAQGYFYSLNLRSYSLSLLDVARPKRKKEHDLSALKRLSPKQLRLGAPVGTKVIHVYDSAAINYRQWIKWKTHGIYLVSREKANSRPIVIGTRDFDESDPRNIGILSDENVGVFSGVMIRRVRYQDPATGEIYSFVTDEFTLPPGLIAFLYKMRWDIEKCFDQKKNKLDENKAWGTTDVAKSNQAHFICMAHNLLVLLERKLDRDEGMRDEKILDKRRVRLERLEQKIRADGRIPNPLVFECNRITQRSLQFIRWLRYALTHRTSWSASIKQLRPLMAEYIS